MQVSAKVQNSRGQHHVELTTDNRVQSISIAPRPEGYGSSATGGELLFLALATCYCNDLYREARIRDIELNEVEVQVDGEFGAEGEPARNITYRARIGANADTEEIRDLMRHTDTVAEIQNTLRRSVSVELVVEANGLERPN
jgi:organic hydroperoxide reductase OsmC/OhrA